jgi:hypothetical protein
LHLCSGADARLDVLFVHGLTGTPKETWTNADGAFWPKWLCADLPGVSVYTLGYPASMFGKWAKKEMDLHERAASMLEHLAAHGIGKRPIALVCHSLGGILAKEMLRTSAECNDSSWQQIAEKTRFAAFLATPHTGASLAAAIKFAVPRLSSRHIELLSNDSGYLTSLNQSYRDLAIRKNIATVPYYEKHKLAGLAVIVSRQSADPGVGSIRCIPVDADHESICKPVDQDAPVYVSLSRRLGEVADQCISEHKLRASLQGDDYAIHADSDRRDLLQK